MAEGMTMELAELSLAVAILTDRVGELEAAIHDLAAAFPKSGVEVAEFTFHPIKGEPMRHRPRSAKRTPDGL